jgi:hypothetical protein
VLIISLNFTEKIVTTQAEAKKIRAMFSIVFRHFTSESRFSIEPQNGFLLGVDACRDVGKKSISTTGGVLRILDPKSRAWVVTNNCLFIL